MTIEWRDPVTPDTRDRRITWTYLLQPLIEQPGRWAMVRRVRDRHRAISTVSNLRNGGVKIPPGKWDFASEDVEVFARYIGPE